MKKDNKSTSLQIIEQQQVVNKYATNIDINKILSSYAIKQMLKQWKVDDGEVLTFCKFKTNKTDSISRLIDRDVYNSIKFKNNVSLQRLKELTNDPDVLVPGKKSSRKAKKPMKY